jgi:hypothetical protein
MTSTQHRSPHLLWVYAYEIVPPQASKRLDRIRALVEGENLAALTGRGAWAGRLVLEKKVTHILIVSDTPVRNREINCQLAAELERLNADFSVTEPLVIGQEQEPILEHKPPGGNGR